MKKVGIRLALAAATLLTSLGVQAGVLRSTVTFDPVDTSGLFFPPALVYGDEFYQSAFGRTMWFEDDTGLRMMLQQLGQPTSGGPPPSGATPGPAAPPPDKKDAPPKKDAPKNEAEPKK